MKTPEKIYFQEPTKVRTEKKYDNDVEYIRTDAFIEKACEWLKNNLSQKVSVISSGYVHINFDNAIEEFRKYMEE